MLITSEILESLITYIRKALFIYKRDSRDIKESLYLPQILKILKSLFILERYRIFYLSGCMEWGQVPLDHGQHPGLRVR